MSLIAKIKKELLTIPGWQTKRKLVIIESDDWGSIRMPSADVFDRLKNQGLDLTTGDSQRYNQYDTLASTEDFESLFHLLQQFKDVNGRHPVFTAVSVMANPDFERIKGNNFQTYYYKPFTETLKLYYPKHDVFQYWQQGITERLFVPEFHGREHLNVHAWMKALQQNDKEARLTFDEGLWGYNNQHPHQVSFQAAFDLEEIEDIEKHEQIIEDGLKLFQNILGYKASLFVPPNGIIHEDLYDFTSRHGIEFMYSSKLNPVPVGVGKVEKRFNYLGKRNKYGQIFITRNAFFEPSQQDPACVQKCLDDIALAFRWKKPAILSSHRVNYVGALDEKNRKRGLEMLKVLLRNITTQWPDVEFMTTAELGRLIKA